MPVPLAIGRPLRPAVLTRRRYVPFTVADATGLTEAGYVDEDVGL